MALTAPCWSTSSLAATRRRSRIGGHGALRYVEAYGRSGVQRVFHPKEGSNWLAGGKGREGKNHVHDVGWRGIPEGRKNDVWAYYFTHGNLAIAPSLSFSFCVALWNGAVDAIDSIIRRGEDPRTWLLGVRVPSPKHCRCCGSSPSSCGSIASLRERCTMELRVRLLGVFSPNRVLTVLGGGMWYGMVWCGMEW